MPFLLDIDPPERREEVGRDEGEGSKEKGRIALISDSSSTKTNGVKVMLSKNVWTETKMIVR